jgi:hypothetical protein
MSKGEKEQKLKRNIRSMKTGAVNHEDRERNDHMGSMSVSTNAKGGYYWKVGFH